MIEQTKWVEVSLPYATFGIAVRGGKVIDAAPIARWTIGKSAPRIVRYYKRQGATVRRVS